MRNRIMFSVLVLFFSFRSIIAGGFQINEHGSRAMGMGGAFTAVADDPSAIYFNGAGLSFMQGTNFLLGTTLIAPATNWKAPSGAAETDMESQVFFPSHFFASHTFGNSGFSAGLGFTTPFGLGTKWPANWPGRFNAVETELMVFTVSPVVSYLVTENFALSAGFVYSWANVTLSRILAPQVPVEFKLEGDDKSAFGYNFGAMFKQGKLSLGASFHSQVEYNFEGDAVVPGVPQVSGPVTAELTTPFNLAVGAAYDFSQCFKMSLDFQYVGWESYDTLAVNYVNPQQPDQAAPRLYENSFIVRLGGEYKASDRASIQAGVYFDKNPVKAEYTSPSLPEGDRLGFSAGLHYKLTNKLSVNASYLLIKAMELEVTNSIEQFNGTYSSTAHLGSVSLQYAL